MAANVYDSKNFDRNVFQKKTKKNVARIRVRSDELL